MSEFLDFEGLKTYHNALASKLNELKSFSTKRDFEQGTLIKTNIDYSKSSGDPFYVEIKGNTYFSLGSVFIQAQGYIYNDTITSYSVTNLGVTCPDEIIAMNLDGNLCFWFPRITYWQGYSVKVTTGFDYNVNRVVDVIDSADPGGTKRVILTDYIYRTLNTENSSVSVSGNTLNINLGGNTVTADLSGPSQDFATDAEIDGLFSWINDQES